MWIQNTFNFLNVIATNHVAYIFEYDDHKTTALINYLVQAAILQTVVLSFGEQCMLRNILL